MLGFIFKFSIYFSISFLILAFPINNQTIFKRLNNMSAPLTKKIYSRVSVQLMQIVDQSADGFKKLFSNSSPNWKERPPSRYVEIERDLLRSRAAAPTRKRTRKKVETEPAADEYTDEENRRLLELLD